MRQRFELIQILRETLKHLEQQSHPDDSALLKLKSTMLQAIADLESLREDEEQCA